MDFNGAILTYRAKSLFRLQIVERFHQSIHCCQNARPSACHLSQGGLLSPAEKQIIAVSSRFQVTLREGSGIALISCRMFEQPCHFILYSIANHGAVTNPIQP